MEIFSFLERLRDLFDILFSSNSAFGFIGIIIGLWSTICITRLVMEVVG